MSNKTLRIISIHFDASREPLDELFWCEGTKDGAWTNIVACDRLRSRREIAERLAETEHAIVGVDFPLGFPSGFMQYLQKTLKIASHEALAKAIRDDLKKNSEDGIRKWIGIMGEYRETDLESVEETLARIERFAPKTDPPRRRREPSAEMRRSKVERFRRVDRILRHKFQNDMPSTLGIQYNKLTRRYEFSNTNARGRTALLGMALLEQIREAKPGIVCWPFSEPADITICELFPKLFEEQLSLSPEALKKYFDREEDNGLFVPNDIRDTIYSNAAARSSAIGLLGMFAAESRSDKFLRPLRDYRDGFYSNDEVRTEGWVYGVGFKDHRPAEKHTPAATDGTLTDATVAEPEAVQE